VESLLFDNAFAENVELPAIYQALWQPRSGASRANCVAFLPQLLHEHGYVSTLITDEPQLAELPLTRDFVELIQFSETPPMRAEEVSQTLSGRLFSAACEEIESTEPKRFIWLHSRGMYGPWDAPLALQESQLALEEGDPLPSEDVEPPNFVLDATHDADAVFQASCGYAAQVMVLDDCIAALRELISTSKRDRWLVVLLGVRGFPLGEHGRIGGVDDRLYVEQLHVPLLWRFPSGENRLVRSARLTMHADLLPMLTFWLEGQQIDLLRHDALVAKSATGTMGIRTAEWMLRLPRQLGVGVEVVPDRDAASTVELFVRPDDRWEANNVAALCPEVVESLRESFRDADASKVRPADSR
jgi:hypothetical protein